VNVPFFRKFPNDTNGTCIDLTTGR